jgi:type II secretory pathway pseudopilin PulG
MTIIKRADLGRPLTWDELDNNFQQVDDLTAAASAAVSSAAASAAAAASSATASANSALDAANSASNAATAIVSAVKSTVTFTTGGTLNSNLDRISDGTYLYYWTGTYPVTVPAGSTVAGTGGIAVGFWAVDSDQILRDNLSATEGFGLIGACPDIATLRTVEPVTDGFFLR